MSNRWVNYNPNPAARNVGDCAVRAVAKALNIDWEQSYARIVANGFSMADMPSSDGVWGSVLRQQGFTKHLVPESSQLYLYTVDDFAADNPTGTYVLGTGNHAVTVVNGLYYDTWDSGNEIPVYYWKKETR